MNRPVEPLAARYPTAAAFQASLADRLRRTAKTSRHSLTELQRQFAYQRLLARVFDDPASPWVLKGGTGLLVRFADARHSIDVDLYRSGVPVAEAVDELRAISRRDLGDHVRFEVGAASRVVVGVEGARVPVTAFVGARQFAAFKVDVVTGLRVTGEPELLRPEPLVDLPELAPPVCRVYPLADHIADKVCAISERHGAEQRPSTRYRDLVDLVLIAHRTAPRADEVAVALRSESGHRGLVLVAQFDVPTGWAAGYGREARRAGLTGAAATLDGALRVVRAFLGPVLAGQARGTWSPEAAEWRL